VPWVEKVSIVSGGFSLDTITHQILLQILSSFLHNIKKKEVLSNHYLSMSIYNYTMHTDSRDPRISETQYTVSHVYLWALHPRIQPTVDRKYSGKKCAVPYFLNKTMEQLFP
jgi:hypothetical protein